MDEVTKDRVVLSNGHQILSRCVVWAGGLQGPRCQPALVCHRITTGGWRRGPPALDGHPRVYAIGDIAVVRDAEETCRSSARSRYRPAGGRPATSSPTSTAALRRPSIQGQGHHGHDRERLGHRRDGPLPPRIPRTRRVHGLARSARLAHERRPPAGRRLRGLGVGILLLQPLELDHRRPRRGPATGATTTKTTTTCATQTCDRDAEVGSRHHWTHTESGERRWPMALGVIVAIALQAVLPDRHVLHPTYIFPLAEFGLLVALIVTDPGRIDRRSNMLRWLPLLLILVLTFDNLLAVVQLIDGILNEGKRRTPPPCCWPPARRSGSPTSSPSASGTGSSTASVQPGPRAHGTPPSFAFPEMQNPDLVDHRLDAGVRRLPLPGLHQRHRLQPDGHHAAGGRGRS